MVLRQVTLNGTERIGFICFIAKFSFVCCFEKKGCPHHEKTAFSLFHVIFPSLIGKNMFIILLQVQV